MLYLAIKGGDRNFECFVYQPVPGAAYACMTEKDATHSLIVTNGMAQPVNGVLTSTFGFRKHPILGVVRLHKGVDWKAPVGTPIMAAFDGTIAYIGDGKGYGNVIRIDHGNGRATAYAHMSRFEPAMHKGSMVHAGDVIGYVGTTGLSTGPHLHFELYQNSVAVDPLGGSVAALSEGTPEEGPLEDGTPGQATPAAGDSAPSDSAAVEKLVNRIIHVESGGSARAKNPKSSATGLGQFIKSTWLRMMKTYRPELFRSMSTEELLELRFDPTLSREMVANLARENEARLRHFGHSITAGPPLPRPFPWAGRRPSGAGGIQRCLDRRADGRFGHSGQSFPDRQGLRIRDRLGREEDERQGGDLRQYPVGRHRDGGEDLARVHSLPRDHDQDRRNGEFGDLMAPGASTTPRTGRPRPSRRPWRSRFPTSPAPG